WVVLQVDEALPVPAEVLDMERARVPAGLQGAVAEVFDVAEILFAVAHAREVQAVRSGDGSERLPALDQLLMKRVELIGLRSCVLQPLPLHDRSFEQRGGRVGVVLEQLRLAAAVPAQVEATVERSEERRVGKECRSRW